MSTISGKADDTSREESFSLYRSIYDASSTLSNRARGAFLLALAQFYFEALEPDGLPRDARLVFEGVRYRVIRARSTARAKKSAQSDYNDATEPLHDAYNDATGLLQGRYNESSDMPTQQPSASVPDYENCVVPAETYFSPADVPADEHADVHADSWGCGAGEGWGCSYNPSPSFTSEADFLVSREGENDEQ